MNWGAADPDERGPIVVSRLPSSFKIRNAIGAYSGSYSIYRGLAVAMGDLPYDVRLNIETLLFTPNTTKRLDLTIISYNL